MFIGEGEGEGVCPMAGFEEEGGGAGSRGSEGEESDPGLASKLESR